LKDFRSNLFISKENLAEVLYQEIPKVPSFC